jgi:hypothetical protein
VLSLWSDPAEDALHREWTRDVAEGISCSSMVSFPNFVAIDDAEHAGDSFSPTVMRRLRHLV